MQRVQLVLALASATRYYMPAGPVLPSAAMPALQQPADLSALSYEQLALQRIAQPPARRAALPGIGVETVAAFALAGVAGFTVSSLSRGRTSAPVSARALRPTARSPAVRMGARTAAQRAAFTGAYDTVDLAGVSASGAMTMDGIGAESGGKVWDPLGLADLGSEKTLNFFRHAELKHGRVAMATMVGFLVHINHLHFPGEIGQGVTFESLSQMGPFEAWSGIPMLGQIQILFTIAGIEFSSESKDPDGHYMRGGTPGNLKFLKTFWDPVGFTKKLSPEELTRKRNAELKNGRLAMIGIMSCVAATAIPGSVPLLEGAPLLTGPAFVAPLISTAPMI